MKILVLKFTFVITGETLFNMWSFSAPVPCKVLVWLSCFVSWSFFRQYASEGCCFLFVDCFRLCKTVFLSQTCSQAYSGKVEFIEGSLLHSIVIYLQNCSILGAS